MRYLNEKARFSSPEDNLTRKRKLVKKSSEDEDNCDDTDIEDRENRRKSKRSRRRLSKKLPGEGRTSTRGQLDMSYGNLSGSMHSPASVSPTRTPTDKKTLREIYSTCSALFQAHKITPQNAFSLKLVECLDEIIQSEDFDKQNLPLLARTLEIGGKIYVCRVDCTHAHTVKLASEIASHQTERNADDDDGHGEEGAADQQVEEGENAEKTKKRARPKLKKRSRFIENDEAKLNTRFEDQSSKYVTRRTSLKAKLHRNIDEELEFDYLSFFVKPGEPHPLERIEESTALDGQGRIPQSHVNEIDMKQLTFFPFNMLSNWNSKNFDIWGMPLSAVEPLLSQEVSAVQQPPVDGEFAYNPETRPDEYPAPEIDNDGGGFQDNDFMGGDFDEGSQNGMPLANGANVTSKPLAIDRLKSLKDLQDYFSSLRGIQLDMKSKYGWAGPIFLKPQRLEVRKRADLKVPKKGRKVKPPMVMDYDEVDWKDPTNRYMEGGTTKTTVDDKTLAKWSETKTSMPYCSSHNFLDYDEDEEEYNDPFLTDDCEDYISNIVRFFIDSNRNIFKLMEEEFKEGKDVLSQSIIGAEGRNDSSDRSMEIEAPRDYNDDSFGNDRADPALEVAPPQCPDPYTSLFSMLPPTLGLDTDDPMSKVSEIDSIKFSKQPKPIDMHELKRVILDVLTLKLLLNEDCKTSSVEDTSIDLLTVICETLKRIGARMLRHMTISIIVVGLMHVVAEKRLFMSSGEAGNSLIICRGSTWKHKDNIPMARTSALDF